MSPPVHCSVLVTRKSFSLLLSPPYCVNRSAGILIEVHQYELILEVLVCFLTWRLAARRLPICFSVSVKMAESLDNGTVNTFSSLGERPVSTTSSLPIMNVAVFVEYLKKTVLMILHGEQLATSPMLDTAFEDTAHLECIKKFLCDPNTTTIFVQKSVLKGLISTYIY